MKSYLNANFQFHLNSMIDLITKVLGLLCSLIIIPLFLVLTTKTNNNSTGSTHPTDQSLKIKQKPQKVYRLKLDGVMAKGGQQSCF